MHIYMSVSLCPLCMPSTVAQLIDPSVTMCLAYVIMPRQSVYSTYHLCRQCYQYFVIDSAIATRYVGPSVCPPCACTAW